MLAAWHATEADSREALQALLPSRLTRCPLVAEGSSQRKQQPSVAHRNSWPFLC
jgi:hypothetical protein